MKAPSDQEVIAAVQEICSQAIASGQRENLTIRGVMDQMVVMMDLEESYVRSKPVKSLIKTTATAALQEEVDKNSDRETKTEKSHLVENEINERSSSFRPSENSDGVRVSPSPRNSGDAKASASGRKRAHLDTETEVTTTTVTEVIQTPMEASIAPAVDFVDGKISRPPSKKGKGKATHSFKSAAYLDSDGEPQDSPSPPPSDSALPPDPSTDAKKAKNVASKPGRKKSHPGAQSSDKDEDKIKRLKAYVLACGVRKQWKKEFKDHPTSRQQIQHLLGILEELGMTGRLSMTKAKDIGERRALEAEVSELTGSLLEEPNSAHKQKRKKSEDGDTGEEEEQPTARQRKINPFAFLGQNSEGESD